MVCGIGWIKFTLAKEKVNCDGIWSNKEMKCLIKGAQLGKHKLDHTLVMGMMVEYALVANCFIEGFFERINEDKVFLHEEELEEDYWIDSFNNKSWGILEIES